MDYLNRCSRYRVKSRVLAEKLKRKAELEKATSEEGLKLLKGEVSALKALHGEIQPVMEASEKLVEIDPVTQLQLLKTKEEELEILAKALIPTGATLDKLMGLWEFPGGKIDTGESAEEALRREIIEELGIELGSLTQLPAVTHAYDFGTIQLIPFLSEVERRPQLNELHAHAAARWIALDKWDQLQWAPADLPIIERLLKTELSK